mmetsp:Transcript_26421/g.72651  ORF Transcript_26421/g.72651 Transcript_26421/m.72651 type:complete len:152 (+) Transcript_26421:1604-2059(+)
MAEWISLLGGFLLAPTNALARSLSKRPNATLRTSPQALRSTRVRSRDTFVSPRGRGLGRRIGADDWVCVCESVCESEQESADKKSSASVSRLLEDGETAGAGDGFRRGGGGGGGGEAGERLLAREAEAAAEASEAPGVVVRASARAPAASG